LRETVEKFKQLSFNNLTYCALAAMVLIDQFCSFGCGCFLLQLLNSTRIRHGHQLQGI